MFGKMSLVTTRNGEIEIAYETFGSSGRPLLLIQGAGAPMIGWPDDFCALLVERGFRVARFDNRDAGRSSRATKPYTLAEMAAWPCSTRSAGRART
jgi:pimeloyl-ACP methyl ester carboxylesterase